MEEHAMATGSVVGMPPRLFAYFHSLRLDAVQLLADIPSLDDEQLLAVCREAHVAKEQAFRIECAAHAELHDRAHARGGPKEAAKTVSWIAAQLEVDSATIYKNAQIHRALLQAQARGAATERLRKCDVQEALGAPDVQQALDALIEKRDADPFFTRMDARAEVRRLKISAQPHTRPTRRHGLLYAAPDWEALEQPAEQLGALRVWELAQPDAVLFLRCPPHRLPAALGVVRRWDFTYQTHVVLVTMPRLLDRLCGRLRVTHDLVLWAVRGMPPGAHTALEGSVMRADALYDTVAALYPSLEPAVVRAAGVCDTAAPWPTAGEPS